MLITYVLAPTPVASQIVIGQVLESGTMHVVIGARVVLTDAAHDVVAQSVSDQEGRFRLEAPSVGSYYLMASRIGYSSVVDGVFDLGEEGFMEVTIYVRPDPVEVEGLTAVADRPAPERRLTLSGFYDRIDRGFGDFLTPEEIERRNAFDASQLLQGIIGVRVERRGVFGERVTCNGLTPRLYLDGALVDSRMVNSVLEDVDDIAGMEIYKRASSLPLQYGGLKTLGQCVFLVWTKG